MKFFIDTADTEEVRRLAEYGLVDGVTTNPSLIAKAGRNLPEVIREMCSLVPLSVSAEVTATGWEKMVEEGRILSDLGDKVAVKVPINQDGLRACHVLTGEGRKVNVTLVFSTAQALLAAKAGATYVSPFMGRLDDIGHDGLALVEEILDAYEPHDLKTEIIAASIRTVSHVVEAAKLGAHIATIPPKILWQMVKHPLTDKGLEAFLEDWRKTGQSIGS